MAEGFGHGGQFLLFGAEKGGFVLAQAARGSRGTVGDFGWQKYGKGL